LDQIGLLGLGDKVDELEHSNNNEEKNKKV
jgi:hypothetical protein